MAMSFPKPPSITPRRMSLTASAVAPGITCSQVLEKSLTGAPVESSTSVTGRGSQCRPRAAKVAYACASSSGLLSETPRIHDGTFWASGTLTPMSAASCSGSHMPVCVSSWAKNVLTDCCVPE